MSPKSRGRILSTALAVDPYPHLSAIADRGELAYRPGFGWVSRPVAS